ncbi:MAG: hypothetical protein M1826_007506 [Phylliscum demangeonii]|nr:MAG: hypothetical protein M1826_007506 [Phylliscum demangeonii]
MRLKAVDVGGYRGRKLFYGFGEQEVFCFYHDWILNRERLEDPYALMELERSKLDQREDKVKADMEAQIGALERAEVSKLKDKEAAADDRFRTWARPVLREIDRQRAEQATTEAQLEKRTLPTRIRHVPSMSKWESSANRS